MDGVKGNEKMNKEETIYGGMTRAEKEVADYLQEINLYWLFENPVFILDEKERPRVWTPDFYLPELGIYIEVCGQERTCYDYRKDIYKKNRIQIIFIHQFKKENDWKEYLKKRIVEINAYRSDKVIDTLMKKK